MVCKLEISRFVDDYQPGIVECRLVDAYGKTWKFTLKAPYVSPDHLDRESAYPRPGTLECELVKRIGNGLIRVSFDSYGNGEIIDVRPDQLIGL